MRYDMRCKSGKLAVGLVLGATVVFAGARASGGEPGKITPPSGFVITADEAALSAIIEKVRFRGQGLEQPEVIPTGAPVNAVASGEAQAAPAEPWRMQWFDGRWWFWTAENRWKWWDEGLGWVDFNPTAVNIVQSSPPVWSGYYPYCPGCYGYQPVQVFVGGGSVTVSAGPVYVGVGGGHVAVSVFGIGYGF